MPERINILVTGGTGFLGSAFLDFIVGSECRDDIMLYVISSGRTSHREYEGQNIKFITHDLKFSYLPSELEQINFEILIHLATSSTIGPTFDEFTKFDDINIIDNTVIGWARNLSFKRVIWASSGAVYGCCLARVPFSEDDSLTLHDLGSENAYRVGKIQSEFKIKSFCAKHRIECCIMRLFAFSGEFLPLDAHFALGNFVRDAIADQRIVINGSGYAVRSYLDQLDFSRILLQLIFTKNIPSLVNIGSPNGYQLCDVAEIVGQQYQALFGTKVSLDILNQKDDRESFYVPSIQMLQKSLNIRTLISLENSIRNMIEWHIYTKK